MSHGVVSAWAARAFIRPPLALEGTILLLRGIDVLAALLLGATRVALLALTGPVTLITLPTLVPSWALVLALLPLLLWVLALALLTLLVRGHENSPVG
ncbi:hypothetical protein ACVC7V_10790 [Hydrogenophaga sp. A37]|uniref:hypothetical protein n=1 Tax=Hydrogenophaga sp. A37 TaxID=1945864 RepID=UPI000986FA48|nr:hypothetical protein [Hydrogenophaga sp. A37]OOG86666.1 hypothetical protein B0E41_05430 [Hydrogenophaga sp. A37]